MRSKGQTPELQANRLHKGRCPIHGLDFIQVGAWYRLPDTATVFTIRRCPRRTCLIHAMQERPGGPAVQLYPQVAVVAHPCGRREDARTQPDWTCQPELVEAWPAHFLMNAPGSEPERKPRPLRYLRPRN